MHKVTLYPTAERDVFTDGTDFEALWTRSKDFGGEIRFWHQSGYGSFPESDVQVITIATDDMRHALSRCIESQTAMAEKIDAANRGDPYASLMVREDIDLLRKLEHVIGVKGNGNA